MRPLVHLCFAALRHVAPFASRRTIWGMYSLSAFTSSLPLLPWLSTPLLSSAPFMSVVAHSIRCGPARRSLPLVTSHPITKQKGIGVGRRTNKGRVSFLAKVARDPSLLHTRLRRFALQRRRTLRRWFQRLLLRATLILHLDRSSDLLSLPLRGFLRRRLLLVHGLVRRIILGYCVSRVSVD